MSMVERSWWETHEQRCIFRILVRIKSERVGRPMLIKSVETQSPCWSGCGSLVDKVLDRGWLVSSSNPVPLKTCLLGEQCTLNLSRAQTSSR
ncbi:hypothetical protein TNCV_1628671 [Trichonephila clavipes]|nr:hypothetical protein TNCV_1628671 [Trichonephila clavipes]